jgi:hypothetical protein
MVTKLANRICEQTEGGNKILKDFMDSVHSLAGMTVEMFEENKTILLSPIFRELILDKAKLVRELQFKVQHRVAIDYPDFLVRQDKEASSV